MKQRVVVQAIITADGKTLLLRRSQGRPGIVGKYELPGGTLDDHEQPDDAMRRHLKNELGLHEPTVQLIDAMSMKSREDGDVQHVFVVYNVVGLTTDMAIRLGQSYDRFEWVSSHEIQQYDIRDSALYLLKLDNPRHVMMYDDSNHNNNDDSITTTLTDAVIYSDGGSRGNPGPSAAAFVIMDTRQSIIATGGEYLGITTNNQAEYHGVRLGLEHARDLGLRTIEFRIDSMLVVNQLRGIYKIKNRELWPINERITVLLDAFDKVIFKHVPRELNQKADGLVNKLLNEHQNDAH